MSRDWIGLVPIRYRHLGSCLQRVSHMHVRITTHATNGPILFSVGFNICCLCYVRKHTFMLFRKAQIVGSWWGVQRHQEVRQWILYIFLKGHDWHWLIPFYQQILHYIFCMNCHRDIIQPKQLSLSLCLKLACVQLLGGGSACFTCRPLGLSTFCWV